MRTQDPTAEQAIAESRLRSIAAPGRRSPRRVQALQPWPASALASAPPRRRPPYVGPASTAGSYALLPDAGPPSPPQPASDGTEAAAQASASALPPVRERPPAPVHVPTLPLISASSPFHSRRPSPDPLAGAHPTTSPSAPGVGGPRAPSAPSALHALRAALGATAPKLDPGGPGLRVIVALAVLAAAVAAVFVWRAQPVPEPLPAPSPVPHRHPAPAPSPTARVTVHITGKVRKPGIYTLPMGARVADAVTAAGGVRQTGAAGSVNLARRLVDGEQIAVGVPGGAADPSSATVADPAAAVLDLNTATPEQLEQLPGVGQVLAARIVEFRTSRGGFTTVEQLQDVPGIGAKKYTEIKGKVRLS